MMSSVRPVVLALFALGAMGLSTVMLLNARERRPHRLDAVPLERRIAVLPFRNLSVRKDDEFLADGLYDAVITQLSRLAELHVTSRQSVRAYRNSERSIQQIGQALGVGTVVDASVQRVGDTLRVAVQVIDARKDEQLGGGHYERPATAIFSLENDVALGVAELLEAGITPTERAVLAQPPTRNAQAYTFYLKGREYFLRHQGPARGLDPLGRTEVVAAEELFRRAIASDSTFALAHAALSAAHAEMYWLDYDRSPARRDSILTEAKSALRLRPELPEGHLAMGYYWYIGHEDWVRALPEFEIASRGMPSDGQAQMFIANVYRRQGRWNEALAGHERAFHLAPRESDKALNLARTYEAMRRYADAARTLDYAIAIEPTNYGFVLERGRLFVDWQGALDSLQAALGRIPASADLGTRIVIDRMELALFRRQPLVALAALKAARPGLLQGSDVGTASWILLRSGQAHEMLGDTANARRDYDAARVMLERAIETVEKAGDESFDLHANLSLIYAALGWKQKALDESHRTHEILPEWKDAWAGFGRLRDAAEVYARVGDYDAAFALLERQLTTPAGVSVQRLRLDPRWDPLRRDPRFQRLLARHTGVSS
jgi:serine/threonine-protein kinase